MINFVEKSINCVNVVYFRLVGTMNIWEVSSLMRHYLSPMNFVHLDSPTSNFRGEMNV